MSVSVLVADPDAAGEAIAADVLAEYSRATFRHRRFSMAVPGGSVGTQVFPALARLELTWNDVDIFWVDERAVAPTDEASNYALAASLWLEPSRVPPASVHRMAADRNDLNLAAADYSRELASALGPSGRLDYVLLGVGPDGHIASLFPGSPALGEASRTVVAIEEAPKAPVRRLTLTIPVLVSARRVVVAAFGHEKAQLLGDVLAGHSPLLPLTLVLQQAERGWLVVDRAAGSRLPERW